MEIPVHKCPECNFESLTPKGLKIHYIKMHSFNRRVPPGPICHTPRRDLSSEWRAFPAYLPPDFEMGLSPEERKIFLRYNPVRRYNHVHRVPCRRNSQQMIHHQAFSTRKASHQAFSDRGLLDESNGTESLIRHTISSERSVDCASSRVDDRACDSCTNQGAPSEPLSALAAAESPSSESSFSMSPDCHLSPDERSGSPDLHDACTQIECGIPRPTPSSSCAFKASVPCESSEGDQRQHILPSCSRAAVCTRMGPCHMPARACSRRGQARPRGQTRCGGVLRGAGHLNYCQPQRHMECSDTCRGSDSGFMPQLPLACGSGITRQALNLRDTWPTCFSEAESLQTRESLLRGKILTPNFLNLLGSCTVLDYSPYNTWDLVLRCSVCWQPVCGLQEMEKHIKAHLPAQGQGSSYRNVSSRTPENVLDNRELRNVSDTVRGPSPGVPASELRTPHRERRKSF